MQATSQLWGALRSSARLTVALLALALVACGGGGGSAGTSVFGSSSGTSTGGSTVADIVLTLSSSTITSTSGGTVTATAIAVDSNRNTVSSAPVTFSADANGVVTPGGTATDSSGKVTATVGIGSDTSLRNITVTAKSGSFSKSAVLTVTSGTTTSTATLAVTLSSTDVTSATPATVTAVLKDAQGAAVSNAVVAFTTTRGTLAATAVASALTDSTGTARTTLRSLGSGVQGADQLNASATVASVAVTGQASFTVLADSPTLSVSPSNQSVRYSTGGGSVAVVARNAAGVVQPGVLVSFSTANGLLTLGSNSVLTDSTGTATVTVKPIQPSSSGIDTVTASATVAGRSLSSQATVQVVAESPSLSTGALSSSALTSTAPATWRVVAKDLSGNLLSGVVVRFTSSSGLLSFSPASAATDKSGEASTVVSPVSSSTSGADIASASLTYLGTTVSLPVTLQVSSSTPVGTPTLSLALSTNSISTATSATVTATLKDAQGNGVAGQVVSFKASRGLGSTNVGTALTQSGSGSAIVLLSPTSATTAGADDLVASVTYGGVSLTQSLGFQVTASPVTLDSFTSLSSSLSAYGQTTLTLNLTGATPASPVGIAISSACVSLGKATVSPTSFSATSGSISLQYRDAGCGALQASDVLQAVVTATGVSRSLTLPIASPTEASVAFISASPEQIYLKGSGFTEASTLTFEVRDSSNNPLPNRSVSLKLLTTALGVAMDGVTDTTTSISKTTDANGRVTVRINSGGVPTPVRVQASITSAPTISTVSSNLSIAVGLPTQINFSLSQGKKNIEGYDIDGTPNTYQVIAADRNGNPVPAGTSINFVTEGGQIQATRQIAIDGSGIARTTANFVSADPRPVDGRVTITAYALGEESFVDLNGNNLYDAGEPFLDLGNIFKDRNFDGLFDSTLDEYVPLSIANSKSCVTPPTLFTLDATVPSVPGTCDGIWSGAGQVFVRRAAETVLSTSAARPLWLPGATGGLTSSCSPITLQTGPLTTNSGNFVRAGGDTWYGGASGSLNFLVADANPGSVAKGLLPRLNPMAAGTQITASTPTPGFSVSVGGGSPVPSTTEATSATIAYAFTDPAVSSGVAFITFTSPSGTSTTISVTVRNGTRPSACTL